MNEGRGDEQPYIPAERGGDAPGAREFLKENIARDFLEHYGVSDGDYIDLVAHKWFEDEDIPEYRYGVIERLHPQARSILDMSSGCGIFVLHGLEKVTTYTASSRRGGSTSSSRPR